MSHCNLYRLQMTFSRQAFNAFEYKNCHRHSTDFRDVTNIVQPLEGLRVSTVNLMKVAFHLLGIVWNSTLTQHHVLSWATRRDDMTWIHQFSWRTFKRSSVGNDNRHVFPARSSLTVLYRVKCANSIQMYMYIRILRLYWKGFPKDLLDDAICLLRKTFIFS